MMPCDDTLKWTTVVLGAGSSLRVDSIALVTASGPVKLSVSILATYNTLQAVMPTTTGNSTVKLAPTDLQTHHMTFYASFVVAI